MSIKHFNAIVSRLATGRAWRGQVQKAVLKVIADEIQGITDELILISKIRFIIEESEILDQVRLNDGLYTLGSTNAMLGAQSALEGKVTIWEWILDLLSVGTVEERLNTIIATLVNVGNISLSALQNTLQDAGFDVYVHCNANESSVLGVTYSESTYFGGTIDSDISLVRYVDGLSSVGYPNKMIHEVCVNYIDAAKDGAKYDGNFTNDPRRWEFTFFIGGSTKLTRANVDAERKSAFRELILRSKPMGMWALLLIDYV